MSARAEGIGRNEAVVGLARMALAEVGERAESVLVKDGTTAATSLVGVKALRLAAIHLGEAVLCDAHLSWEYVTVCPGVSGADALAGVLCEIAS